MMKHEHNTTENTLENTIETNPAEKLRALALLAALISIKPNEDE